MLIFLVEMCATGLWRQEQHTARNCALSNKRNGRWTVPISSLTTSWNIQMQWDTPIVSHI